MADGEVLVETKDEVPAAEERKAEDEPTTNIEASESEEKVEEPPAPQEPEETPEEKVRKEQERLDAQTSYIDTLDSSVLSLKDVEHPELGRPGFKATARRGITKKVMTFAELEEQERKRQEEALKPRQEVDQKFEDTYGLLEEAKKAQRGSSMAHEAQNVHAAFMQKAKERKEKEEAAKRVGIEEERMSSGRPKSTGGPTTNGKVDVNLEDGDEAPAKRNFMDKLKEQGCCTIS